MEIIDTLFNNAVERLGSTLYEPYQPYGCKWMLNREIQEYRLLDTIMPKGGILADEVGLGKTIMTVSVILGNLMKKTLIILPKSLITQWVSQIKKFSLISLNIVVVEKDTVISENDSGIFIMSQSLFNCRGSILGESPVHNIYWDRVIIDEAHSLRNRKSKYYESCCLIKSNIRWALTATPVMNRMTDFINIMNWVGVEQYFCQAEKDIITKEFLLRRTKDDVKNFNEHLELPKCYTSIKYIPFESEEETQLYLKTYYEGRDNILLKNTDNYIYMLENLLRIRQICIHPQLYYDGIAKKNNTKPMKWNHTSTKIKELLKCFKNHEKNEKTLIFCQFVKEMTLIGEELENDGHTSVRIDGTMSIDERATAVDSFKKDPNIKVFLIQINTGGQGINLQIANRIYIMAPNWNPALEHQAIGRSHRTGQKKNVFVTKFVTSSGDNRIQFVEENIIKLQEHKQKIVNDILNENVDIDNVKKICLLSKIDIFKLFNIYNHKSC